jgi:hypothetical protein
MAEVKTKQRGGGRRTSFVARKIEAGIRAVVEAGEIKSEDAIFLLSPSEGLERINPRLRAEGLKDTELPTPREVRRYWRKRANALASAT